MKTNQQELNLKFNTMKRQENNISKTKVKYLTFLEDLKYQLDNNNNTGLRIFLLKHKVTNSWSAFLNKNGIVYKNSFGYYEWNDKIPPSIKIVNKFMEYSTEYNSTYNIEMKQKHINKNRIDSKKVIKVEPKLIRENHKNTNTQEIGLIRKFLKWIY
jgi:hypothetical protein